MATDGRKGISSSPVGDDGNLVVEILIRLPDPRSAFRCRPVCKKWNALISTPYFRRRFFSHRADRPRTGRPVLTLSQVRESISSFLPFPPGSEFSILDSSNNKDLLLLGFWPERDPADNDSELLRTHLVCNPFTKQWVALPLAPKKSARNCFYRWVVKLVCAPPSNNSSPRAQEEFRVVRMRDPKSSASSRIEVCTFCSTCGQWAKIVLRLNSDLRNYTVYRTAVSDDDGKLYWLNKQWRVVKWDPFHGRALPTVLDDGSQLDCDLVQGPWILEGLVHGPWISEGALHVVYFYRNVLHYESASLSIWRLNEKGGGWSKLYEVEDLRCNDDMIVAAGCGETHEIETTQFQFSYVVGVHPEKSEIVFMVGCNEDGIRPFVLSWDFRKRKLEFLGYQGDEIWSTIIQDVGVFFQPRITSWPSLILSQEKLRNAYNGRFNCWLPSAKQPKDAMSILN